MKINVNRRDLNIIEDALSYYLLAVRQDGLEGYSTADIRHALDRVTVERSYHEGVN